MKDTRIKLVLNEQDSDMVEMYTKSNGITYMMGATHRDNFDGSILNIIEDDGECEVKLEIIG